MRKSRLSLMVGGLVAAAGVFYSYEDVFYSYKDQNINSSQIPAFQNSPVQQSEVKSLDDLLSSNLEETLPERKAPDNKIGVFNLNNADPSNINSRTIIYSSLGCPSCMSMSDAIISYLNENKERIDPKKSGLFILKGYGITSGDYPHSDKFPIDLLFSKEGVSSFPTVKIQQRTQEGWDDKEIKWGEGDRTKRLLEYLDHLYLGRDLPLNLSTSADSFQAAYLPIWDSHFINQGLSLMKRGEPISVEYSPSHGFIFTANLRDLQVLDFIVTSSDSQYRQQGRGIFKWLDLAPNNWFPEVDNAPTELKQRKAPHLGNPLFLREEFPLTPPIERILIDLGYTKEELNNLYHPSQNEVEGIKKGSEDSFNKIIGDIVNNYLSIEAIKGLSPEKYPQWVKRREEVITWFDNASDMSLKYSPTLREMYGGLRVYKKTLVESKAEKYFFPINLPSQTIKLLESKLNGRIEWYDELSPPQLPSGISQEDEERIREDREKRSALYTMAEKTGIFVLPSNAPKSSIDEIITKTGYVFVSSNSTICPETAEDMENCTAALHFAKYASKRREKNPQEVYAIVPREYKGFGNCPLPSISNSLAPNYSQGDYVLKFTNGFPTAIPIKEILNDK